MTEEKRVFRAAAVEQARQIQAQKQIRDRVYDTIIEFVDLPSDAEADASNPSTTDLQHYRDGIGLLSLEDFDQIALERNIYEKCGYSLCPKEVKASQKSDHTIKWAKKGENLSVISQREVPMWCSNQCEKYAYFIRKQLSTEPSWEQQGALKIQLPFYTNAALSGREEGSGASRKQDIVDKMKALSIERGDTQEKGKHNDVRLLERSTNGVAVPPPKVNTDPGSIDGYEPQMELSEYAVTSKIADDEDFMEL
ncbi:MAG: hypothetical protein Q9160_001341 [Pyrenula sp. 1 TL-2023]